jgi:hypothetical protein
MEYGGSGQLGMLGNYYRSPIVFHSCQKTFSSVLAICLVSMARKEGITLTVKGIFEYTSLRELALIVRENIPNADLPSFALLGGLDVIYLCR